MKHIELKHGKYEITLLTKEEYKRYKNRIPLVNCWWWLRSPGFYQSYAAGVYDDGGVSANGLYADFDGYAVRPVLKSEDINLTVGERFISLGNRWVVIDGHVAISEDVITHRRYDKKSNDWETSELKLWLEEWALEGEYDE